MLQVITKDGKSTTFSNDFVWYKDTEQNALVIYRDLSDTKNVWVFGLEYVTYFYAGTKEVKLNG